MEQELPITKIPSPGYDWTMEWDEALGKGVWVREG